MSYIGNSPGVASQRVVTNLTATSGQTRFVAQSGYTLGYIDVLRNGIDLVLGEDYTATDGIGIDLTVAATAGDKIKLVAYIPRGLSDGWTKDEADARFVNTTADTVALAANGFSVGTNQLVVNSGNVGIGTASPSAILDIHRDAVGDASVNIVNDYASAAYAANLNLLAANTSGANYNAIVSKTTTGTSLWRIYGGGSANTLVIETGGTERMRVTADGKIGVNNTLPLSQFEVTSSFVASTAGSLPGILSQGSFGGGIGFLDGTSSVSGLYTVDSGASLAFFTGMALTTGVASTQEKMRITSNGNLLIGTITEANANTRVYAVAPAQDDNNGIIRAYTPSNNSASFTARNNYGYSQFMQWTYNGVRIGSRAVGAGGQGHLFFTVGNDQVSACLDGGNGNLLVGRGAVSYVNSVNSSTFYCSEARNSIHIVGDYNGNVSPLRIQRYASDGDGITFFYGNSQKGYVSVSSTGTSYNTLSDYRLKENVRPLEGALDKVLRLNPVSYDWIGLDKAGQGFIAHELQAIVPECVTGEKDAVDKDGKPVYQGIDTSFLVGILTKAIQEQQAMINELRTEINLLKGVQ